MRSLTAFVAHSSSRKRSTPLAGKEMPFGLRCGGVIWDIGGVLALPGLGCGAEDLEAGSRWNLSCEREPDRPGEHADSETTSG